MNQTDQELISSYVGGDHESFSILVRRHLSSVYNFIVRFSGNESDAGDITQETFLKVWKNIKKFDNSKKFKTWLFTIAKNTSLDWLRKRHSTPFSELSHNDEKDFDIQDDSIESAEEVFERREYVEKIAKILKTFSPLNQSIITMKINEDMTFQEISEILSESVNTVKSRYRRALILLKEKIIAPKAH